MRERKDRECVLICKEENGKLYFFSTINQWITEDWFRKGIRPLTFCLPSDSYKLYESPDSQFNYVIGKNRIKNYTLVRAKESNIDGSVYDIQYP